MKVKRLKLTFEFPFFYLPFSSPLPMYYYSGLSSVSNTDWFISHDVSLGPAVNMGGMSI